MASTFLSELPLAFLTIMDTDEWHGGHLIDLPESEGVRTPTKAISKHHIFLKAVVSHMPGKARSHMIEFVGFLACVLYIYILLLRVFDAVMLW